MIRALAGLCAGLCAGCVLTGAALTQNVAVGQGAMLRGLDKTDATVSDLDISNGGEVVFGTLSLRMTECRYPEGDAAADAYAYLVIRDLAKERNIFSGWMLASSPALNALEHPRYDVWVLRCITE
ncbi:MAG: DUF2155 domain-containing protein [Pseudomonadota bacterium]